MMTSIPRRQVRPTIVQQRKPKACEPAILSKSISSASENSSLDETYYSYESPPLTKKFPHLLRRKERFQDLPPAVLDHSTSSSLSVATYDSLASAEEGEEIFDIEDDKNDQIVTKSPKLPPSSADEVNIPAVLPPYRASIIDPDVRPSDPKAFGRLFPSLDRLSVRHDEFTADGNMNLRVDTVIPAAGRGKRPVSVQLFHLRMHDLARREFSLRRYCRDSGREVCNSKRAYLDAPERSSLQQSVTSAFRSVKGSLQNRSRRSSFAGSSKSGKGTRPSTAGSFRSSRSSMQSSPDDAFAASPAGTRPPVPTKCIKLEFGNYARVDVLHRQNKGYCFAWWGHRYVWKAVVDKALNSMSFHLIRDGQDDKAVAHIVPEVRSPNQVFDDEEAGGWIPPCHMWISDETVVDAKTDVADVIMATGLIALVDHSIADRWQVKKPKPRRLSFTGPVDIVNPKNLRTFLTRRFSHNSNPPSTLPPHRRTITAH